MIKDCDRLAQSTQSTARKMDWLGEGLLWVFHGKRKADEADYTSMGIKLEVEQRIEDEWRPPLTAGKSRA